ncbi:hypothetical protein VNO77_04475 [Canavalia gladiata]|uniref:Uncharacterized protein n=1 Tax=Canavalia gladiata TaxID=3824 RepID=A0AAN9N281_CANGL
MPRIRRRAMGLVGWRAGNRTEDLGIEAHAINHDAVLLLRVLLYTAVTSSIPCGPTNVAPDFQFFDLDARNVSVRWEDTCITALMHGSKRRLTPDWGKKGANKIKKEEKENILEKIGGGRLVVLEHREEISPNDQVSFLTCAYFLQVLDYLHCCIVLGNLVRNSECNRSSTLASDSRILHGYSSS